MFKVGDRVRAYFYNKNNQANDSYANSYYQGVIVKLCNNVATIKSDSTKDEIKVHVKQCRKLILKRK